MTLVNARAAFETAIKNAVTTADNTVTMVFDNMPFTTPGKTKKYVMVNLDFTQSTTQPQGAATDYYAGTIRKTSKRDQNYKSRSTTTWYYRISKTQHTTRRYAGTSYASRGSKRTS